MSWIERVVGSALILMTLTDIYLTVLYTRAGASLVSFRLYHVVWRLFRRAARARPERKDAILSFSGPTLLVVVVAFWFLALLIGFALVLWPALGSAIQASQGPTPTDFATALYYSGYGQTTLGTGDIVPKTGVYRLLLVLQSMIGFSVLTLTLTYFMSVYNALQRRNSFAIALHHQTGGTDDAVDLLARLGAGGTLTGARQEIDSMAREVVQLFVSHQNYPILHFFRFPQPYYAIAQMLLICMDTASLIQSAFNQQHRSLTHSAAVAQLWGGGLQLLHDLARDFLPASYHADPQDHAPPAAWREHYYRAIAQLEQEGIAPPDDVEAGLRRYCALRQQWNPYVVAFAEYMAYSWPPD